MQANSIWRISYPASLCFVQANDSHGRTRYRVKSLIGKALLFRNAAVPKNNLPLHIPFLAHDNCRANLETWIRQLILQHKHVAIPLFLPTHRLRKQGFPTLSEILHNHRKMERRWKMSHTQNLPRCCKELRSIAKQHIQKQDMSPSTWTTSTCHQSYTSLPTPTPTLRISFAGHNISTYVQKR